MKPFVVASPFVASLSAFAAFAAFAVAACTPSGTPKEVGQEPAPSETTSTTSDPVTTAPPGSTRPDTNTTSAAACTTDADCKLHSSYCQETPCSCLALGKDAATPTCAKPAVNCFVDPCMKRIARCKAGVCEAASP